MPCNDLLEVQTSFLTLETAAEKTISLQGPFSRTNSSFIATWTRSPSSSPKNGNLNIYNFMTTEQAPSADEDHVISSKAPEQLLNGG